MSGPDITAPLVESRAGPDPEQLRVGSIFDRYLVIDQVGAGGAGEVYAAYDPNLDRRVALKVLRGAEPTSDAATSSDRHAALLVREAQALAKLSHPNVVTVHDVGVVGGRTFIAMELVAGCDLATWFQTHPAREHWQRALALLIEAGKGLAAAHARDTIHRDFKPANVLVGDDGRARVTDFGLATLLSGELDPGEMSSQAEGEDLEVTRSTPERALVGTPYYMAPELFDGVAASKGSDIYAYCIALYEGLYGERPFEAEDVDALVAQKASGVPAPKGAVPSIPKAIRNAIARGLDPDPARRWPSMAGLLAVLETRGSRSRRWMPIAAVAIAVPAVGFGMTRGSDASCTGAQDRVAEHWNETRGQAIRSAFEATGLDYAERTVGRVVKDLDGYAESWAQTHQRACEATVRGEQSDSRLDAVMACLDRSLVELDTLAGAFEVGRAETLEAAASATAGLSDPVDCSRLDPSEGPKPPAPELAAKVEATRRELARAKAEIAAGLYAEAKSRAKRAGSEAEGIAYAPLEAEAGLVLGRASVMAGDPLDGAAALESALWVAHGQGMAEVQARAALELAPLVAVSLDRAEEGGRWLRYAESQLEHAPRASLNSRLELARGMVWLREGKADDALAAHQRAVDLQADDPLLQADALDALGIAQLRFGKNAEAEVSVRAGLELREAELGSWHPLVALSLSNLGPAIEALGDVTEAQEVLKRSLEIRERSLGLEHDLTASSLANLASTYFSQGKFAEAERYQRRAAQIRRKIVPPPNARLATVLSMLASIVAIQRRQDEAAELFEESIAAFGDDAPANSLGTVLGNYAGLLDQQGKFREALAMADRGIALYDQEFGPGHPDATRMLSNQALYYTKLEEFERAVQVGERALAFREAAMGPDHPSLVHTLGLVANAQLSSEDVAGAIVTLERALGLCERTQVSGFLRAMVEFTLAQALAARRDDGDVVRATALAHAARTRFEKVPGQEPTIADIDRLLDNL